MKNEIWKDIPGYEGLYQVSNLGNIKSIKRFRKNKSSGYYTKEFIKKQSLNSNGYNIISLYKNNKQKTLSVHRLIGQAFIPNPENKPQINHINGIRNDNRIENLEWNTASENLNHKFKILGNKTHFLGKKGKLSYVSKKVNQYNIKGEFIKSWDCIIDIKRELGIDNSNIVKCCKGKINTAGGYIWRY